MAIQNGQAANQPAEVDGLPVTNEESLNALYDELGLGDEEPITQAELDYYRSPIEQDELQE
jgi:hypothetical protein